MFDFWNMHYTLVVLGVVNTVTTSCSVMASHETSSSTKNNNHNHRTSYGYLTNKRSLESTLRNALLLPLDQRGLIDPLIENSSLRKHVVERVSQDIAGDGDREQWSPATEEATEQDTTLRHAYPYNDYLLYLRSGVCHQREKDTPEFVCPSPDLLTRRWTCINVFELCDDVKHCPNGEDELPVQCLYYQAVQSQINRFAQSLLRDPTQ